MLESGLFTRVIIRSATRTRSPKPRLRRDSSTSDSILSLPFVCLAFAFLFPCLAPQRPVVLLPSFPSRAILFFRAKPRVLRRSGTVFATDSTRILFLEGALSPKMKKRTSCVVLFEQKSTRRPTTTTTTTTMATTTQRERRRCWCYSSSFSVF